MAAHFRVQLVEGIIFAHESVCAAIEGFLKQLTVTGHSRKHNDWKLGIVGLKKPEKFEAVLACEVYVQYDHIKGHLIHEFHGLSTAHHAGNTEALLLKKERKHFPNGRLVIDK
jgi:hypothetical protein